ncbi:myotubularin-related protein 8-like isoform X2 [Mercenaria mercenaria]|uniref:myotubularin-related protein 8-like isoform X2 n=1 Tax=Mercenaria mercenaria TaxID=6596 RepID=UPI00234F147C|nr:myotubularin-related protein 8-like isoform X2 [Mercenaria mercenaria]
MDHIKTPKVDNVKLLDRFSARNTAVGTLYLTTTHLIFVDSAGKKEIWILHMHLSQIEKLPITTGGSPLQLHCKNFMCITFVIPKERDCHDIYTSLLELSKPGNLESLYAFSYQQNCDYQKDYGWDLFDTQSEYMRMGAPNEYWVLSNINKEYEICDTYPRYLFVPAKAATQVLIGSSKFRSRGRLPVLSYFHIKNQAAICRCSQPLAGFSARCVEDEQMLHAILKANPNSAFMYVVDTRPKINAMANRAAGKGYENEAFYSDMKFQFCGIENIHVMRASLQKLIDVCELKNPPMSAFLSGLEASGWLKHIQAILETSVFISKAVLDGVSVLVHCSDGWDRTAQTCSLSSLMLDPYYRTISGFMALIEKEWLAFGHKFTDRCGLLSSVDNKETSPVFTQFLECVWQMMQQFPCAFQFNDRFLITLHDHVYSCQFGTFIGNCEKDRVDLKLSDRTFSLWGFLSKHKTEYLNPLFKKEYEVMQPVLIPKTYPQCIRFWRGMYNRFETGIHPRDQIKDILSAAKDHSSSLEDHVRLLERRLTQICQILGKSDETIQQTLQGCVSMDSLDGDIDDNFHHKLKDKLLDNHTIGENHLVNSSDFVKRENLEKNRLLDGNTSQTKSDSESGFDESCSQMSRSGIDDRISTLEPESMSHSESLEKLNLDQLHLELESVAVDWRPFRNIYTCSCAMPFDHFMKKFHCWKCGEVFCTRCIARNIPLPGHDSQRPVPVCKPCYRHIRHSPSMEFNPLINQSVDTKTT